MDGLTRTETKRLHQDRAEKPHGCLSGVGMMPTQVLMDPGSQPAILWIPILPTVFLRLGERMEAGRRETVDAWEDHQRMIFFSSEKTEGIFL